MVRQLKTGVMWLTAAIVFCGISYQLWILGRDIHYSVAYESMVIKTIDDRVKENCLNPVIPRS